MAASLNVAKLLFQLEATLSNTVGLAGVTAPINLSYSSPLSSGTGANQADKIYSTTVTLAGSATSDLDLAGALTDALGSALTFARIKLVGVFAAAANNASNLMQVTRPSANGVPLFLAAGDGIALRPGACFIWHSPEATGVAVTAGTGDLLTFTNGAGTNTISADVVVIGASA